MPEHALHTSAYAAGALTPTQVLAFHRLTFGDARMGPEEGGDGAGDGESGKGGGVGKGGQGQGGQGNEGGDAGRGFPADTPLNEMTGDQREAYWKHQARKHEGTAKGRADYDAIKTELDKLKAATQTESEKALEKARQEGRDEATNSSRQTFASKLVAAELRAELKGVRKSEEITKLLDPLDLTKFLTGDGEVDTDKVKQYAAGIAPAGNTWPDTGAGHRGRHASAPGQAGLDEAARRFGKPDASK